MVAVVVDRVAPVHRRPAAFGEVLVLRHAGPSREAQRHALVDTLDFLQEHQIGVERAQSLAQLVNHHAPVELRQPLVNVERRDA